jgi:hypothetical protein
MFQGIQGRRTAAEGQLLFFDYMWIAYMALYGMLSSHDWYWYLLGFI